MSNRNGREPVAASIRFWSKVDKRKQRECWPWKAACHRDGYGWFRPVPGANMELAHRVSWKINRGAIPKGLYVLHKCDNPCCVNPKHLFLGTQLDNMRDMLSKGRSGPRGGVKGEDSSSSKVTANQVRDIRKIYARGNVSYEALGRRYDVAGVTIGQIVRRDTWKCVK